ncbi:MAG TPA: Zn-ribbon domain-containing OB-fold protein [Actinomycetota bacterium]
MFDKPAHPDAVRLWPGSIPISHRYTAGLAGERFFRALAERGVFLASRCTRCSLVFCPPAAFCERCLDAVEEELEVGPSATLESFTVVRVGFDGGPLATPVVVGLIRLDGADTCLVHRVAGDPAALSLGIAVEAVLRDPGARKGSLNDVEHFRLSRGSNSPEPPSSRGSNSPEPSPR